MIKYILAIFGKMIVYRCEWGDYEYRYDAIDRMMGRPIHMMMSVAPPWAEMKIVPLEEDV